MYNNNSEVRLPNHEDITLEQIKLASKLTGSAWAVVAQVGAKGWEFPLVHKLNKKKRAVLDNYIKLKAVQTMLDEPANMLLLSAAGFLCKSKFLLFFMFIFKSLHFVFFRPVPQSSSVRPRVGMLLVDA